MKTTILTTLIVLLLTVVGRTQDVPLRSEEDFKIQIDYDFKQKEIPLSVDIKLQSQPKPSSMLPFLVIRLTLLNQLDEEVKFRFVDGASNYISGGKIKDEPIMLEFGFTDDIKDGVKSGTFYLFVTDKKRNNLNKVKFEVQKDGTFLVNNKLNGKF